LLEIFKTSDCPYCEETDESSSNISLDRPNIQASDLINIDQDGWQDYLDSLNLKGRFERQLCLDTIQRLIRFLGNLDNKTDSTDAFYGDDDSATVSDLLQHTTPQLGGGTSTFYTPQGFSPYTPQSLLDISPTPTPKITASAPSVSIFVPSITLPAPTSITTPPRAVLASTHSIIPTISVADPITSWVHTSQPSPSIPYSTSHWHSFANTAQATASQPHTTTATSAPTFVSHLTAAPFIFGNTAGNAVPGNTATPVVSRLRMGEVLEEFNGTQDVSAWIRRARFGLHLEAINEARKIRLLKDRVTDRFRWDDTDTLPNRSHIPQAQRQAYIDTFERLELWLKEILIPDREARRDAAESRLRQIRYVRDEDPYKFREKVARLLKAADYKDDRRGARVVLAMLPPNERNQVWARNPQKPSEVFNTLEDLWSFTHENSYMLDEEAVEATKAGKTKSKTEEMMEMLLEMQLEDRIKGQRAKNVLPPPRQQDNNATCLYCGQKGHWAARCPEKEQPVVPRRQTPVCNWCKRPGHDEANCYSKKKGTTTSGERPKCFNCGAEGHLSRNCNQPRRGQVSSIIPLDEEELYNEEQFNDYYESPIYHHPWSEREDHQPHRFVGRVAQSSLYGWGKIDGQECRIIFDTGSSHSLMPKEIAEKLRRKPDPAGATSLQAFNKTSSQTLGVVKDLPIQIGTLTIPTDVQVVPMASQEILLGMDWLRKGKALLDLEVLLLHLQWKGETTSTKVFDDVKLQTVQAKQWKREGTPIPRVHFEDEEVIPFYDKDIYPPGECRTVRRLANEEQYRHLGDWLFDRQYDEKMQYVGGEICPYFPCSYSRVENHHCHYFKKLQPEEEQVIEDEEIPPPCEWEVEVSRPTTPEGTDEDEPEITKEWTTIERHFEEKPVQVEDDPFYNPWGECKATEEEMFPPDDPEEEDTEQDFLQKLDINPALSTEDQQLMKEMLLRHRSTFVETLKGLGKCNVTTHHIETGNSYPIKQHAYRVNTQKDELIEKEVERLLKAGLIRPSRSPWASPVVIAWKANGKPRFCVDLRKLNGITVPDAFPIPRIQDLFDAMSGSRYFSALDAAQGYHQIAMHPDSIAKTAFVTSSGTYEWLVMPFGLTNAPAEYQRVMNLILRHLKKTVVNYIDDTCVHTKTTFKEHVQHLEELLETLAEANLHLTPAKCHFGYEQLQLLGHIISKEGLKTDPKKVQKLLDMPAPKDIGEVRSFLGLAGYYRRFIKDFALRSEAMKRLLRKDTPFKWGKEQQEAFENIAQAMATADVVAHPDLKKPFIVTTDASGHGLGAILSQKDEEGQERVVQYASRGLNKHEENYSVTKLEALAVYWAVNKFAHYLGARFTLVTDHSALKTIFGGTKPLKGQLARWALELQEFKYDVVHREGKANPADALSRLINNVEVVIDELPTIKRFLEGQEVVGGRDRQNRIKNRAKQYKLQEGTLYRKKKNDWIPVIEQQPERQRVMRELHNDHGHPQVEGTFGVISTRFWWPGMFEDVKMHVQNCGDCAQHARPNHREESHPLLVTKLFDRWQMDLIGPLPVTARRNRYICVAVECLTRWAEAAPLRAATAEEVEKFVKKNIIPRFGCPRHLQTDNGTHFSNKIMQKLTEEYGIQHHFSTAYHPQSNGMVERLNQTLAHALARTCHGKDWDLNLDQCLTAYRTTRHSTTGQTPAKLLFGEELTLPVEVRLRPEQEERTEEVARVEREKVTSTNLPELRTKAAALVRKSQEKRKLPTANESFKVDELVYRYRSNLILSHSDKFTRKWDGPYRITAVLDKGAYFLTTLEDPPYQLPNPVNGARLRKCYQQVRQPVLKVNHRPKPDQSKITSAYLTQQRITRPGQRATTNAICPW